MSATHGQGSYISVKESGGASFTKVNGVKGMGEVGQTNAEIDVTPIDATSSEYIAGIADGESKTIVLYRDSADAGQNLLKAGVGTTMSIEHTFSNSETATHDFVVLGYKMNEPAKNQALEVTVTGRISGDITWA